MASNNRGPGWRETLGRTEPFSMKALREKAAKNAIDKDKEDWIGKATDKMKKKGTVGAFSKAAKERGETTKEYADQALAPGSTASPLTKQRANFARNVSKAGK